MLYQSNGRNVGVEPNNEKALAAIEKELELYPDNKKNYFLTWVRLQTLVKKDEAAKILQKEIESTLKSGLKDESDYNILENLYVLAKLPEQQKFVAAVRKEKFPNGQWTIGETLTKFFKETDPEKKKAMLTDIIANIESDKRWENTKQSLGFYKSQVASAYSTKKDWVNVKKTIEEYKIDDKIELATLYNSAAWAMQKDSANLPLAEEFSRLATTYMKEGLAKSQHEKTR
jgi:hypothetical protein